MHTRVHARPMLALMCLLLPASASAATPAKPSEEAPALAAVRGGQNLCYSASVLVNDKKDAALVTMAETQLAAALKGLGLKALQYDAADTCDRELYFSFSVDVDGEPTIYQDFLTVYSYVANDGKVELPMAQIWRDGMYGGNKKVLTRAEYTKTMTDDLKTLLDEVKVDYASLK
ncbi:hypothetical protein [Deinococcus sonorensis]|uniref:Uncharacterized protein n=2 Tax=Deinococcus sonorensis TaxID=309891 RepID=A0AAU7U4B6_9DEIO